jgi:hypothetical protein
MTTTSIFRQALKNQISTNNHLFNTQEIRNQHHKNNPNLTNENTLIYVKEGKLVKRQFNRNGLNADLVQLFGDKTRQLDELARADYKAHKTAEKQANPSKKIRTVLQTKDLKKEFGIFLGGDKFIGNKAEFEQKIVNSALKILEKKGLDKSNIISIVVHYDEKTPHAHIQYNDYSFKHKTTGQELGKVRQKEGLNKQQLLKLNRANFGEFQDILAQNMGMSRGQKDSKQVNISKTQYYENIANNKNGEIELSKNLELKTAILAKYENYLSVANNEIKQLKQQLSDYKNVDVDGVIDDLKSDLSISNNYTIKRDNRISENLKELFEALGLDKIKVNDVMEKETDDLKNNLSKIELFKQQQFIKLQSDYDAIALQHKQLIKSINVEKEKQITKHKNIDLEIS